jgi:hypothetical protein
VASVRLTLYISTRSPLCEGVPERLKSILSRPGAPRVELRVHDLAFGPPPDEEDPPVFTPSVVVQLPTGERRIVVGDLRNDDVLRAALRIGELDGE